VRVRGLLLRSERLHLPRLRQRMQLPARGKVNEARNQYSRAGPPDSEPAFFCLAL
jgi:hypothetical protein